MSAELTQLTFGLLPSVAERRNPASGSVVMTNHLPGTWRWVKHLDREGKEDPSYADYSTFTFAADGTGSIDGPGTLSYPLKWKIVGGRLRYVVDFGAGAKKQATASFEMPTRGELIIIDPFRHRDVYERVKK